MKTRLSIQAVVAGSLAWVSASAWGADLDDPRNRFRLGAQVGFNLSVNFSNRGGAIEERFGPAQGGGLDRQYNDGAVRVDSGGNAGGKTWNWSYTDAAQVAPDGSGIAMHGYSGSPYANGGEQSDDPQWGAEFGYTRIIGEVAGALWGIELGLDWLTFDVRDDSQLAGTLNEVTDTYALNGVIPPAAPYSGSFEGPGPLLSDSPARITQGIPTVVQGLRQLEGDMYTIKLGPMLDIPLGDWLSAQLSGGLAVTLFDGDFQYSETAFTQSGATWVRSGRASSDEWLFGGYVRGQLTVRLDTHVGLYAAISYQGTEDFEIQAAGAEAKAELNGAVFLGAGIVLQF